MNLPEKRESAKIFEGWNGMKSAFDELFKRASSKEYIVFAVSPLPSVEERFRRFIFKVQQKKSRLNIPLRILINKEFKETIGTDREKEPRTKVRYVPKELSGPAAINVYGDWTLVALWADPPSAFIIENEEVANSFRNYFDMLWENASPR
ncbi:hypothetical protein KKE06_02115 [Candidatus Micrarchaeota archaeon]|nr:hypothetical protein [Candidatus Micrarchaeota archaeon]MBU1929974.1 hypothetical protein [Candidatus Micrarchaeota archaeon]